MLTLNDGRNELWQWDTGRKLEVDVDCSQVHFSNKVFGRSIDVDVVDGVATIPDILLQTDKDLNVWAFVGTPENGYTKISKVFKVNKRNKPSDYVFTPPEQTTLEEIKEKLDYLESIQDPDAIKNAVDEYIANNPIQIDEKDPTVPDWAKQTTKPKYTATEVDAVATVNGVKPDANGNVEITIPDSGGNVDLSITGATAGQTVKIAAVDENGAPTAWEAVEFPSNGGQYELIETIVCDGTYGNINRTKLSLKKAKVFLNMKAASAAATVCIEAHNDAGLFGYSWIGNCINTVERFATAWFVSDGTDAYAEFTSPSTTKYNTGSVNRTVYSQNADTPINMLGFYTSPSGNVFPAESTIEIWGVRA